MIHITIFTEEGNEYLGFRSEGHSGTQGTSLICAGVSALMFSAYYQIKYNTEIPFTSNIKDDIIDVRLKRSSRDARLAIQQLIIGLEAIQSQKGGDDVTIRFLPLKSGR